MKLSDVLSLDAMVGYGRLQQRTDGRDTSKIVAVGLNWEY